MTNKMWYLVLFLIVNWSPCANATNLEDERSNCMKYKEQYHILPGESFGSLPPDMHNVYLRLRCYRFFCEPHPLSGKGKFTCIPLKEGQLIQEEE